MVYELNTTYKAISFFFFFQITKENKGWGEIRRSIAQLPEIRPDNGIIYGSFN